MTHGLGTGRQSPGTQHIEARDRLSLVKFSRGMLFWRPMTVSDTSELVTAYLCGDSVLM